MRSKTTLSHKALAAGAVASLLTLAACGTDDAAATADADRGAAGAVCGDAPLRFSDTGVEGLEELRLEFEDFRVALEEATGLEVDFQPMSSRTAAATALEYDDLDVLLTGPTEYVVLESEADALPLAGVTRREYRPALYVRADSDVRTIEELRGSQLLTKEVGSTAGHLGPLEMIDGAGIDPNSGEIEVVPLSGTHLTAFAAGDGDALGSGIDDLGELEELMGEGNVRVLAEGDDLPNDLFVARAGLGEECADYLRESLVENQDVLIEAIVNTGENDKYEGSEFVEAADGDYAPIRRAFVAAGFPEFSDLPDEDE